MPSRHRRHRRIHHGNHPVQQAQQSFQVRRFRAHAVLRSEFNPSLSYAELSVQRLLPKGVMSFEKGPKRVMSDTKTGSPPEDPIETDSRAYFFAEPGSVCLRCISAFTDSIAASGV